MRLYKKHMDIFMAIRSFIFLIAGLALILFPKKILVIQCRVINYLVKKFHIKYQHPYGKFGNKRGVKTNFTLGICFLIVSIILFIFSIIN